MSLRSVVPAIAATVLVLLCGVLYFDGYREQYADLLTILGAAPFRFPFLDTHGVLSAVQCHRLGIDVFAENPCDVFGRPLNYSALWLLLAVLPVTTAWTATTGLALAAFFLASLVLLPVGRAWWQVAVITLAAISGSVAFALERGNVDLVIFILTALVVRLVSLRLWLRCVGYAIAVLAALLKFYPAVLLLTAVRERIAVFIAVGIVATATLAAFAALDWHVLTRVLSTIPSTYYSDEYVFGGRDLPFELAEIFGWSHSMASVLFAAFTLVVLVLALHGSLHSDLRARLAVLTDLEATSLLAGSVLILACFFTAQNVLYRGIYFLFIIPALTALMRRPGERRLDQFPALGTLLILLLMDWEPIRQPFLAVLSTMSVSTRYITAVNFNVWLIRELIWWVTVTIIATLLLALLARSRVWQDLRALARFCWQRARFRVQERRMRRVIPFFVVFFTAAIAKAAPPAPNPFAWCETAIAGAETAARLPPRLLGAIADVESGRPDESGTIRPWPWTIDAEGRGQFFVTKAEAIAAVLALQASGVRSIDVGCMQVNLMHHPNAFASLDAAFDPATNALYAARFLNSLYGVSGSWVQATAAYHSETPAIGADYQRRVMARWQMPNMNTVSTAYGIFAPRSARYADFAPTSSAYGDFSNSYATPARLARR